MIAKGSILDVWQDSEYTFGTTKCFHYGAYFKKKLSVYIFCWKLVFAPFDTVEILVLVYFLSAAKT